MGAFECRIRTGETMHRADCLHRYDLAHTTELSVVHFAALGRVKGSGVVKTWARNRDEVIGE
jgi:hypothetical protein